MTDAKTTRRWYIVVAMGCDLRTLRTLGPLAARQAELMSLTPADTWLIQGLWGTGIVIGAVLNIAVHLFVGRRATRPGVAEFLKDRD